MAYATEFRSIFKQSAIYGIGGVASKAVSIVLFPMYSLFFSVGEYGVIVRTELFWQYLWVLINFGTTIAIFKELQDADKESGRGKVLVTMSAFFLAAGILVILAFAAFRHEVAALLLDSRQYHALIILATCLALLEALLFVPLAAFRELQRPWIFSILTLINIVVGAGGQVVGLLTFSDRLIGMYTLRLLGPTVALLVGWWVLRGRLRWSFDLSVLRRVLSYSAPVMISALLALALSNIDRYLLGFFKTSSEVGLYGLGFSVAGLINLFLISPFMMVFHAILWKRRAEPEPERFFARLMTHSTTVFCFGAALIGLFGYGIIRVFALNPDYWAASSVVPILSFSYVLFGMSNIALLSFYLSKRTDLMILIYGTAVVLNVALNLVLIDSLGMYGAAIASIVAYGIHLAISVRLSKPHFAVPYEWHRIVPILGLTALVLSAGSLISFGLPWIDLLFRFVLCLLLPASFLMTRVYSMAEFRAVLKRPPWTSLNQP